MPPEPKARLTARRMTFGDVSIIPMSNRPCLQSSLLARVDRTVRALRVCNEDVVAELILPRHQIFLFALPLGDLEMALGIAAEDSRRLPGCLENLGRRYFKVVVENVRLRQ